MLGVVDVLAGVIVTFRERLEGRVLAGEEDLIRCTLAAIFGLGRSGTTIDDLDAEPVADVLLLPGAAGFGDVIWPGVITVARRELLCAGRLVDVLFPGVMIVVRRVAATAERVADLPAFDERADDFPAKVLALEVLLLIGVIIVLRLEVDERADEGALPVLATCTERLTGLDKVDLPVERVAREGAEDLAAGAGLVVVGFGASLGAIADLVVFGGAVGRGAETLGADLAAGLGAIADLVVFAGAVGRGAETLGADLGAGLAAGDGLVVLRVGAGREDETLGADLGAGLDAGLLALLVGALGAGREARAGADLAAGRADRLFGADLEAEARADDRAGADLADRDDEDLPLGGFGLPNAGPQAIIAVRSSANSVFSARMANISRSFPGQVFRFLEKTGPADQIELFCFA